MFRKNISLILLFLTMTILSACSDSTGNIPDSDTKNGNGLFGTWIAEDVPDNSGGQEQTLKLSLNSDNTFELYVNGDTGYLIGETYTGVLDGTYSIENNQLILNYNDETNTLNETSTRFDYEVDGSYLTLYNEQNNATINLFREI